MIPLSCFPPVSSSVFQSHLDLFFVFLCSPALHSVTITVVSHSVVFLFYSGTVTVQYVFVAHVKFTSPYLIMSVVSRRVSHLLLLLSLYCLCPPTVLCHIVPLPRVLISSLFRCCPALVKTLWKKKKLSCKLPALKLLFQFIPATHDIISNFT